MVERKVLTLREIRAEGRRVRGTILNYNEVSPSHQEKFLPGSVTIADTFQLNLHHDRERVVAFAPDGGLSLEHDDKAMTMTADLLPIPASDRALKEIRSEVSTGLSIEFNCERDRRENGLRVVERATAFAAAIVRSPSYEKSRIEARRKSYLRAFIPPLTPLVCDCVGAGCKYAEFTAKAMNEIQREMQEMFDRAHESAVEATRAADILLLAGSGFSSAVASARRGSLKAHIDEHGNLQLEAFAEKDTPRAVAEMMGAPLFVRPIVSEPDSEFQDVDGVRKYERANVRAFLLKAIAGDSGRWPEARIDGPDQRQERRRRIWH